MHVEVLAYTAVAHDLIKRMSVDESTTDPDAIAEFGGRACYQSFNKPNPRTRANNDYLANIIGQNHTSVLEHASVTFYITGVSRSLSHELIRHRHLSPSQQSQRYVDESDSAFVEPPLFEELRAKADRGSDYDPRFERVMDAIHQINVLSEECREAYAAFVEAAQEVGVKRKQAREAARSILPNGTETRIVMTGNLRAWRHFVTMRYSVHADAEIRELARVILGKLRDVAPHSVQDIPDEPRK